MKLWFLYALLSFLAVLVESAPSSLDTVQATFRTEASFTDTPVDVVKSSVYETVNNSDGAIFIEKEGDTESATYTAVGILDLSGTMYSDGNKILLRSHCENGSNTDVCWWGAKKVTHNRDQNKLELSSSVIGFSCDGVVLHLPDHIPSDEQWGNVDDILLSLADGIIHRFQAGNFNRNNVMKIITVFRRKEECNNIATTTTDTMNKISEYIQKYLDRAILKLQQKMESKMNITPTPAEFGAGAKVQVLISSDSSPVIAAQNVRLAVGSFSHQLQLIRSKFELIEDETIITSENVNELPMNDFRNRAEIAMAAALSDVEDELHQIEIKIDDAILEDDGNMPMPEFGRDANDLLFKLSESYLSIITEAGTITDEDRKWMESKRIEALRHVAGNELHRIHILHLQGLRDHFGRSYEKILENTSRDCTELDRGKVQARDQQRREGAKRAEEGFLNAAFLSIPAICQDPQMGLVELYSCTDALRGLLEDMYESTQSRGIDEEEWNDLMEISTEEAERLHNGIYDDDMSSRKNRIGLRELIKKIKNKRASRGPAKWYERLAIKALVLGANYVQGWIVLQTLRREARRRDLSMPKFPLF